MKKILVSLIVTAMIIVSISFVSNVRAESNIIEIPPVNEIIEAVGEGVSNIIDEETVQNIKDTVLENSETIVKELTEEISNLRDNTVAKFEEIEEEYGIDLTEYKDKIEAAVEKYQTTEDYTKEDLASEIQGIYTDLLQDVEDNEVKEKVLESAAESYAAAREYVENHIDEIKENAENSINTLKENYPEQVKSLEEIADVVKTMINEHEDSILELVEEFKENPKGTAEELSEELEGKLSELKTEVEKDLKLIKNYIVNGEIMVFDTLSEENQSFDKENASDLTFRFDIYYMLFKKFGKVYVDGTLVGEDHYTSKKGSTVITVNEDYLNTLEDGEHTLKVALGNSKEFGQASSKFTVVGEKGEIGETTEETEETEQKTASPKTGDNIMIYTILFVVATIGAGILVKMKKF